MPWKLLPQTTEVLAIHAALLHTGEIVYFSGDEHDKGQNEQGKIFHTRLFGCQSLSVKHVGSPGSDVFCSGHALLGDGRLLVTGGTEAFEDDVGGIHGEAHHFTGLRDSWTYDPVCRHWTRTAYLNPRPGSSVGGGRWYPGMTALASGQVLAVAGHPGSTDFRIDHNNVVPEAYAAMPLPWGKWRLYGANATKGVDYFARMHVLADGRLFCLTTVGNNRNQAFDSKTGNWSDVCAGPNPNYNGIGVSSVLLPLRPGEGYRPRILACNHSQPLILDLGTATPAWQNTGPRTLAGAPERTDACNVILPTGDVFVCGGTRGPTKDDVNGVLEAELYHFDGAAGTWTTLPAASVVRNYHSVALLMPDGRVWTAGSNHNAGRSFPSPGVDNRELRIELFEPDYYGNPQRPTLTANPGSVACRQTFEVHTPQAQSIQRVVVIRAGSVTHAFDSDQRYIELEFRHDDRDRLSVTAPPNNNIAPPGYYLLFLLDRAGLPSEGKFMQIRLGEDMEGHVILFEHANFHGGHKHVFRAEPNLNAGDDNFFNDRVSSIAVLKGHWAFYRHANFVDRYPVVLGPGLHSFVGNIGIQNDDMSSLQPTRDAPTVQGQPIEGHVILFEHINFHGAHKHVFRAEDNLNANDDNFFNDRASSLAVLQGNWQFYRHAAFGDAYKQPDVDPPKALLLGPALYSWVEDVGIRNDDMSSLDPKNDQKDEIVGSPIEGHAVLFEHINFHGAHKHVLRAEANLNASDDSFFNDRTSSIAIVRSSWGFYRHANFVDQYPPLLGPASTIYPWVEDVGIQNDDLSSLQPWPETR